MHQCKQRYSAVDFFSTVPRTDVVLPHCTARDSTAGDTGGRGGRMWRSSVSSKVVGGVIRFWPYHYQRSHHKSTNWLVHQSGHNSASFFAPSMLIHLKVYITK